MIVKEQRNFVQYTGDIEITKFRVDPSAKLIKILSDGLYSDKIAAVQREISANAVDSHVMAGNTNPFDIKLPTRFDPTWMIRDYGVGLTQQQVKDVYSVYGVSEKDESDDYIGCMGIGAKSIFCYNTKSATVESFKDKLHTTYHAHIGEDGIPVIAKLTEQPTTEPNGLKVTLPVDPVDINNFLTKAEQLYTYFKIKPNFIGSTKPKIKEVKYVVNGACWGVRDTKDSYYDKGCRALMGNIGYPIQFSDTNLNQKYQSLLQCPLDIFFNIGELDIEASREGLSYDARTKTNIQQKLKQVMDEISVLIEDKIKNSKNLWEARLNFLKIKDSINANILAVVGIENIEWNKKKLFTGGWSYQIDVPKDITLYQLEYISYYSKHKVRKSDSYSFQPSSELGIFYDDVPNCSYQRMRYAMENQKYKNIIFFNFKDDQDVQDLTKRQKVIDALGCTDDVIRPVSELDKPPKAPKVITASGRVATTKVLLFKNTNEYRKTYCWDNTAIDIANDSGYYVEVNNGDIVDRRTGTAKEIHPNTLFYIKEALDKLALTGYDKVYGVKTAVIPKLAKSYGIWTDYLKEIESVINKESQAFNIDEIIHANEVLNSLGKYNNRTYKAEGFDHDTWLKIAIHVNKGDVKTLETEIIRLKKLLDNKDKVDTLNLAAGHLGIVIKGKTYTVSPIDSLLKKIWSKYPLLLKLNINGGDYKLVAEYINLIG